MYHTKHIFSNYNISMHILRKFTTNPVLKTLTQKKERYGDLFPDKLLKKIKKLSHMYIANEETANNINNILQPYFKQNTCDTILEVNPGIGVFTRRLLDNDKFKKIILMEAKDYFMDDLQELHALYPERVKVKSADFVNLWRLIYQDKSDNGSRIQELLQDLPVGKLDQDPNMVLFGVFGSYEFFRHIINSIMFQNSFIRVGRAEMYLIIPPPMYLHLTCTGEVGYMLYRSTSVLFQMLFEHRFITRLPRNGFLPIQRENIPKCGLKAIRYMNSEFLYLVRVVPRKDIYNYVALEDLPKLWYFVKQNCISRNARVIPNLEKWVPGCGPRLLVNKKKSLPIELLYDDEDETQLPEYSYRCHTMHNQDHPKINIYTQFGDLTPSQILTLYSEFRRWPEYKESSFLASFESAMLKMDMPAEALVDGMTNEVNDVPAQLIHENRRLLFHQQNDVNTINKN